MDARTQLLLRRAISQHGSVETVQPTPQTAGPEAPATTCCGPCKDLDFCREDTNCCLECHFAYEEELAFPYLPPHVQAAIRQQHAWLIANNFPHEAVEAHAEFEMRWIRPNCPSEIVAQIDDDHDEYGEGNLFSRETRIIQLEEHAPIAVPTSSLAPISVAGRWVYPR